MICFTISYYLVKKNNIYFIFRYIYICLSISVSMLPVMLYKESNKKVYLRGMVEGMGYQFYFNRELSIYISKTVCLTLV